jgi:peroxiredoxin Q/BCP
MLFDAADCVVLGASFDTIDENRQFAETEAFGFRLLSDVDRHVGIAYEVAKDPDEQRAEYARRIAYLIDPGGVIRRSYEVSDVAGFAEEVLGDLNELRRG